MVKNTLDFFTKFKTLKVTGNFKMLSLHIEFICVIQQENKRLEF